MKTATLSEEEITDMKSALVYTMKMLDINGEPLNKILADRLEKLELKLNDL